MDLNAITEQLLNSGKELAEKGQALATEALDIPPAGPERDKMLSNLGSGAAVGGLLAVLLGTGAGRKLTGSTIKLGGLAALGTLAYKTYQNWQGAAAEPGTPVNELSGPAADTRSQSLLRAIIAAAKADGHIDEDEQKRISEHLAQLSLDTNSLEFFKQEVQKPLSAKDVAAGADSPAAAAEIYLVSLAIIDEKNEAEHAYLQGLASELQLAPQLVAELEASVKS